MSSNDDLDIMNVCSCAYGLGIPKEGKLGKMAGVYEMYKHIRPGFYATFYVECVNSQLPGDL